MGGEGRRGKNKTKMDELYCRMNLPNYKMLQK